MFVRANIQKGRKALAAQKPEQAGEDFKAAMEYPEDLGTGRPAQPELAEQYYWLGVALAAQGKTAEATRAWETSAQGNGKANAFSALADRKLGHNDRAQQMLEQSIEAARRLQSRMISSPPAWLRTRRATRNTRRSISITRWRSIRSSGRHASP